jgi:hypothetical protein
MCAGYFGRSLLEAAGRRLERPTSQIRCFVPAGGPLPGKAADTLMDGPADAARCASTLLIDLAFGRDGSIWGRAGMESARVSDPADIIFGATTLSRTSAPGGGRPIARLAATPGTASDTIDVIFSGEFADAA